MKTRRATGMGRREFLVASSGCALATLALGSDLFASGAVAAERLSVGFAELDAIGPGAASDFRSNLTFAERIASSDGEFIGRGARLSVSGAPCTPSASGSRTVALASRFFVDGFGNRESVPFHAWVRSAGCQGSPVRFTMPLDSQRLAFELSIERPATVAPGTVSRRHAVGGGGKMRVESLPFALTLLSGGDGFKLRRGYYVVAPRFDGDSAPRWDSYQLRLAEGRRSVFEWSGFEARPVAFEYLVLRIDYER